MTSKQKVDQLVDQLAEELSICGTCGTQGSLVCFEDVSQEIAIDVGMDMNTIYLHCPDCNEYIPVMGFGPEADESQELGKGFLGEKSTSRNAPCPCGSGKKFKRCCGKN